MAKNNGQYRQVSLNNNTMVITKDIPNIIILVSGTVDPGNMAMNRYKDDPEGFKRSESYNSPVQPAKDTNWYWAENEELFKYLNTLKTKYKNIHIFTHHGWSGDNCINNRVIAGSYLAERLCGANGETAYYSGFLNSEVSFHLIGHSHGGNVINEFTKHISTLKKWPAMWKVRSITYLSTPFFQTIHQVNTTKFDTNCKIFNIYNKYDLTQRSIADFNLDQLLDVSATLKRSSIGKHLQTILKFDLNLLSACLTAPKIKRTGFKMTFEWAMEKTAGTNLYKGLLDALNAAKGIIAEFEFIAAALNSGTKYFAATEFKNRNANSSRKIVSDILKAQIDGELRLFEAPLNKVISNITVRIKSGKFPVFGFAEDMEFDLLFTTIISFFSINVFSLEGRFINLLHNFMIGIVEKFDDTMASPSTQLKNTSFASKIFEIPVDLYDKYYKLKDTHYTSFINNIEELESSYHSHPDKKTMKEIIFTLITQNEDFQKVMGKVKLLSDTIDKIMTNWDKYDGWLNLEETVIETRVGQLNTLLDSYLTIYKNYTVEGLTISNDLVPKRGSLPYLMIISHSVSRKFFHKAIASHLESTLTTLPKSKK